MTQAVITEVSAACRIVRPEPARAVGHHVRRWSDDALPYAPAIELDRHAVGGISCALVPILRPKVARIIDPRARGLTNFVHEIEVPTVLGDVSKAGPTAILNAMILTGKKHL